MCAAATRLMNKLRKGRLKTGPLVGGGVAKEASKVSREGQQYEGVARIKQTMQIKKGNLNASHEKPSDRSRKLNISCKQVDL